MKDNYFIGIAGIIAAGKTTLTKDLAKTLGYKAYFEPVKQNPYLSDFYKDMKRWGAFMQIHLLHARYEQHQRIVWGKVERCRTEPFMKIRFLPTFLKMPVI